MAKLVLHKIWDIFSYILAFAFVLGGTLFVYFYANGYRFNPINGEVKQTGVINVETIPTKGQIEINGKDIGKAPKVTSADVGTATIKISKEGYITWEKTVPVIAEKSTTVTPTLFLTNPLAENIYSTKGKIIQQISDSKNQALMALIQTEDKYKLLRYEINKKFWNITENPQIIYESNIKDIKNINISLSTDGKWALITKTDNQKVKTFEFAKTTIPHQIIKETDLTDFIKDYSIKWSNDSNYLTLESTSEILSYRVTDGTKSVLLKKSAKINYIWNTDSEGFFYYTTLEKSATSTKFSIIQTTLQGGNKKTLLKDVFFQKSQSKIGELRANDTDEAQILTNSQTEELFSGDLTSFSVIPNSKGIILITDQASYWYNFEESNFVIIHPLPVNYISTSPDNNKVLFYSSNEKKYGVFTYNKIEADPLTKLGTVVILEGEDISEISWQKDSTSLVFKKGTEIRSVEIDSSNNIKVGNHSGAFSFTDDLNFLYNFSTTKEKDTLEVIRYKMY